MLRCSRMATRPLATSFLLPPNPKSPFLSLHSLASPTIRPGSTCKYSTPTPLVHISKNNSQTDKHDRPRQKLHILRAFLASYRHGKPIHTPNAVRSLYVSLATRSIQNTLSEEELTTLIKLFGTISLPSRQPGGAFHDDSGFTSEHSGRRCYWKFVLQLVSDKGKLNKPLSSSDKYWSMMALLNSPASKRSTDPLTKASLYYHQLSNTSEDADAILPYLRALLSSDVPKHASLTSRAVCSLLQRPLLPNSVLPHVLACISQHAQSFTTPQKHAICCAASRMASHTRRDNHRLLDLLPTMTSSTPQLQRWAFGELDRLLGADCQQEQTWPIVHALAIYHHQKLKPFTTVPRAILERCGDLGIACLLELYLIPCRQDVQQKKNGTALRQTIRAVWKQWALTERPRPHRITGTILRAFLWLASRHSDGELVEACGHFSMHHKLWDASRNGEGVHSRSLMAVYIASSALVGTNGWRQLISSENTSSQGHPSLIDAVGDAISQLLAQGPLAALRLYRFCTSNQISLSRDTHLEAALRLSALGYGHDFLALLEGSSLSDSERAQVWNAIVNWYRHRQRRLIVPRVLRALQGTLVQLTRQSPALPRHLSPTIHYILPIMAPNVAMQIVSATLRNSPSYFQQSFYQRMFSALIYKGQYRLCSQLLQEMQHAGVAYGMRRNRRALQLRKARTSNIVESHLINVSGLLRDDVLSTPGKPTAGVILGLHSEQAISTQVALRILVQSNRLRTAIHLFHQTHPSVTESEYTTLGNILLHCSALRRRVSSAKRPGPSHARIVRRVFNLFNHLKDRHQFAPDAVTSNILLSAILKWRQHVDASKVRVLFEQFLATAGNRSSVAHSSFTRHIRPMYKQFVKAFHLRGDVKASQAVVGMLQAQASRHRASLERWQYLRSSGRRRARDR